MEYLNKTVKPGALEFVNGPIWADIKRCLLSRRPSGPIPSDQPHEAAAKGFIRCEWDNVIAEIEKLPRDNEDATPSGLFDRPATDPID